MLAHAGDAAHAPGHIYRVLGTALTLAKEEDEVDRDILIAACLLHDVARTEELQTGVDHALAGGDMAYAFLLSRGWASQRAQRVRQCIQSHRYRNDLHPESTEAKLLYDADKLDVVGPIGVVRTIQYGAALGDREPLYRLDDEGHICTGPEGEPSFFQEYDHKLRGIPEQLLTPQGRALAKALRAEGDRFYDALLSQLRNSLESGREKLEDLGLHTIGAS